MRDRTLWNIFNEVREMIKIKATFADGIRYAEVESTSIEKAMQAAQARYIAASEFSVVSIVDENYRGCKIESSSEEALGGWSNVYWSAFTGDLYELDSGFGGGSIEEMFDVMKMRVDEFLDCFDGDTDRWDER